MSEYKKNIFQSCMLCIIYFYMINANAVEFNLDILDTDDKADIDFSRFSNSGYILPGVYKFKVLLNGIAITASSEKIKVFDNDNKESTACVTPELVNKFAFKDKIQKDLVSWSGQEDCINLSQVNGYEAVMDMAKGVLRINIPKIYLQYSDASWLPPSRWENGINGFLLDYNITGSLTFNDINHGTDQSVSLNGTMGANLGTWRIRADYQGTNSWAASEYNSNYSFNRIYAYKAFPTMASTLTVGENSINSDVFDSWLYTGASFESDDSMLPPNQRGYAPQITGVAETNAQVVVSQQGRVIYNTTVPAGSFTIDDLDSYIRGTLDVEIIEQDGRKKSFEVDASYIPNLTRPGNYTYKFTLGNPRENDHDLYGDPFVSTEGSYGFNNNWSFYGGLTATNNFGALAVGVGHDLQQFGSISLDLTQSYADLDEGNQSGTSIRLSYSTVIESLGTNINFAGYRFATDDFLNMDQYLDLVENDTSVQPEKSTYNISLNKSIDAINSSIGVQYNYQSYWESRSTQSYSVSWYSYFDLMEINNISLGLTASRYDQTSASGNNTTNEDIFYATLTLPLGDGNMNYSGDYNNGRLSQWIGYSESLDDGLGSYSLRAGYNSGGDEDNSYSASAYYSQDTRYASVSANIYSYQDAYTSIGMSVKGGLTVTEKGAALHSGASNGSSRVLVKTEDIADVPINRGKAVTNNQGVGVVTSLSDYYRNQISVDLNKLPDDIEAKNPVTEIVLTEGAIGYREFSVVQGKKFFSRIVLKDSQYDTPPFGAVVQSESSELGIVGDDGVAWLTGAQESTEISVLWGKNTCIAKLPDNIKTNEMISLSCSMKNKVNLQ